MKFPLLTSRLLTVLITSYVFFAVGCSRQLRPQPPIDLNKPFNVEQLQTLLKDAELYQTREQTYRIGTGDVISIQLIGRNDILGTESHGEAEFTITDNPMIALPHVGAIRVHGKTALELQEQLKAAYTQWIPDPQPLVIIKKFQANQIAVLGVVKIPGTYPLSAGDTLMDAIFKAGGLNVGASGSGQAPSRYLKVYREKVDRQQKAGMTLDELVSKINEGNKMLPREEITVPIDDYILTNAFTYNIPIFPNDVVYVPPAGTVNVQGRMDRAGIIFLGPSMRTVGQVLTQAGKLKFGARSVVQINRPNVDGSRQSYFLNARHIAKRTAPDFYVQDGDEIFVDSHWFRVSLEFFGNMLSRGTRAGLNASYNPVQGAIIP